MIAPDTTKHGVLQFGTQLITAADGSIGGMLGASPGASTATSIMLNLLGAHVPRAHRRLAARLITQMVPSWGTVAVRRCRRRRTGRSRRRPTRWDSHHT